MEIEIDADEAAIAVLAVIDGDMRGKESAVFVLLIGWGHIVSARGNLLQPPIFVVSRSSKRSI